MAEYIPVCKAQSYYFNWNMRIHLNGIKAFYRWRIQFNSIMSKSTSDIRLCGARKSIRTILLGDLHNTSLLEPQEKIFSLASVTRKFITWNIKFFAIPSRGMSYIYNTSSAALSMESYENECFRRIWAIMISRLIRTHSDIPNQGTLL